MSFDTIPQASLEDMMAGRGAILPSYDETALCSGAFRVLRSMVSAWLRDVSLYKNVFADFQILHFYRYLSVFIMLLSRAQQILGISPIMPHIFSSNETYYLCFVVLPKVFLIY